MSHVILKLLHFVALGYLKLPRKAQVFCGNQLGRLIRWTGYRSSVVRQNLRYAFPGEPLEQERIFSESYRSFGNLILEILLLFSPGALLKTFVLRCVRLEGAEQVHEAKKKGYPLFLLSSHLGNWEVMAAGGSLLAGFDLLLITKRIQPSWLHEALEKGREACGVHAAYEPQTMQAVLNHLREGKAIGAILDQYTGPPVSVRVPFFGVPVGTSLAVATLVKRTRALVFPVENFRESDGTWTIRIRPALSWITKESLHEELAENTAQYTRVLEEMIRAHPEQWLWIHRRFKGDLSPLKEGEWKKARQR